MSLATVYIALGSNVGQRLEQMRLALELLKSEGLFILKTSPIYKNRAVGMGNADFFFNAVIKGQTTLEPEDLLKVCLSVETQLGRVRKFAWSPRTIDLDILLYGELFLETNHLILPHPRIAERDFVLKPLLDVAPDLMLRGQSIRSLFNQLPNVELSRVSHKLY